MNRLLLWLLAVAAISCGGGEPREPAGGPPVTGAAPSREVVPAPPQPVTGPRVVFLGDSLTAGLGLPPEEAYPALLQRRLEDEGYDLDVINAGVSGDTSSDGLQRVAWALEGDVKLLVLALGANDGLRGLPVSQMKTNLETIVLRARQRGIPVLLVGMEAPPNFGPDYTTAFRRVFTDIAKEQKLDVVPFLLDGVAGVGSLNQTDGIHPNRQGAVKVADHLWPAIEKMLKTQKPQ